MIEVRSVTKTYGKKENRFKALDGISFEIPDNAVVSIIGKSGSGKSTLMHVMSGLDAADSGAVIYKSHDIQAMKRKQAEKFRSRQMGFIFQSFFIEPNQSVFQNVMLPLEIARVPFRKRKALVMDALEKVELAEKFKNRARDLSGGQKQRLAIARAIVNKPELIFADEPTGNLDSQTGDTIIKLLFDLNKTLGSTLIIVTHDEELAARAQMRIELKDGKIASIKKRAQKKTEPVKVSRPNTPRGRFVS